MKLNLQANPSKRRRSHKDRKHSERGAALVTMMLVSVLLLGAGGALIMSTVMSANNSVGSTAEMQAYYVAESGMQSALNVLRGNSQPPFDERSEDHQRRPKQITSADRTRVARPDE